MRYSRKWQKGRDVTKNLLHQVPKVLRPFEELLFTGYIRCEVVISKTNFNKYFPPGARLRNSATGLMGKDEDDENKKYLDVVPISIKFKDSEAMTLPEGEGSWWDSLTHHFPKRVDFKYVKSNTDLTPHLTKELMNELGGDWLCDGLVVIDLVECEGEGSRQFAFKFDDEIVETTVTDITWITQDTGKLFPMVHFDPIEISGCTACKASGKSADWIVNSGVGKGSIIKVVRSGEIIPNVVEVVTKGQIVIMQCEHGCDPLHLEVQGASVYCRHPECPAFLNAVFNRLIDVFKPKGFPDRVRDILRERFGGWQEFLEYIAHWNPDEYWKEIIDLTPHQFEMVKDLIRNIQPFQIKLYQLAWIAVVEGLGEEQCKKIEKWKREVDEVSLKTYLLDSQTTLKSSGVNIKVLDSWSKRMEIFQSILEYFDLIIEEDEVQDAVNNEVVCITGKLEGYTKAEFAKDFIEGKGFVHTSDVSKATILINADGRESSKSKTAQKRGIKIMSPDEYISKLGGI